MAEKPFFIDYVSDTLFPLEPPPPRKVRRGLSSESRVRCPATEDIVERAVAILSRERVPIHYRELTRMAWEQLGYATSGDEQVESDFAYSIENQMRHVAQNGTDARAHGLPAPRASGGLIYAGLDERLAGDDGTPAVVCLRRWFDSAREPSLIPVVEKPRFLFVPPQDRGEAPVVVAARSVQRFFSARWPTLSSVEDGLVVIRTEQHRLTVGVASANAAWPLRDGVSFYIVTEVSADRSAVALRGWATRPQLDGGFDAESMPLERMEVFMNVAAVGMDWFALDRVSRMKKEDRSRPLYGADVRPDKCW